MSNIDIEKITNNQKYGKAYNIEIFSFSNTQYMTETGELKNTVVFPAFLKDFNDSYKSEWNSHRVLGKMDPIATFKNTSRTITLNFDIPNQSLQQAKLNLNKIDYIIRGLYPIYDAGSYGTAVLASPPMYRIRFANFIRNAASNDNGTMGTLRSGLLCYFNGFDFKPDNSSGYFVQDENLFPRLINVSLTLNVIHEHPLGKSTQNNIVINRKSFDNFPRLDISTEMKKLIKAKREEELKNKESSLEEEKKKSLALRDSLVDLKNSLLPQIQASKQAVEYYCVNPSSELCISEQAKLRDLEKEVASIDAEVASENERINQIAKDKENYKKEMNERNALSDTLTYF